MPFDFMNLEDTAEVRAKPRWFAHVALTDHLPSGEADTLRALAAERGFPLVVEVHLLRRRMRLATTLPSFAWAHGEVSIVDEVQWLEQLKGARQRGHGYRDTDIIPKNGEYYYRDNFLSAVKNRLLVPQVADALVRFMLKAEDKNNQLIRSNPYPSQGVPAEPDERVLLDGRRHRGPTWTPEEDFVLTKWFSKHTAGKYAGKHAPLTDEQWKNCLLELGGRRVRTEVRRRIRQLNHKLKVSLMVDGMISGAGVMKYMDEALGENEPQLPKHRPRINGRSYWADVRRR